MASTSSRRVAIFDFDSTLSATEISSLDRASLVDRGFGGAERVALLRECLSELTERGIVLAICSLNNAFIIRSALEWIGLAHFFQLICDRSDWMRNGSLKSRVIQQTMLPRLGGCEKDTLFVDDDPANIKDMMLRAREMTVILVPRPVQRLSVSSRSSGIGQPEVAKILEWASSSLSLASSATAADTAPALLPSRSLENPDPVSVSLPPAVPTLPALASLQVATTTADGGAMSEPRVDSAPCPLFTPKRPQGPLSRRCATCGAHEYDHTPPAALHAALEVVEALAGGGDNQVTSAYMPPWKLWKRWLPKGLPRLPKGFCCCCCALGSSTSSPRSYLVRGRVRVRVLG